MIEVLQMSASGLWQGRAHGRTGLFKFINVELLGERMPRRPRKSRRNKPRTVEELLKRIGMEVHTVEWLEFVVIFCLFFSVCL